MFSISNTKLWTDSTDAKQRSEGKAKMIEANYIKVWSFSKKAFLEAKYIMMAGLYPQNKLAKYFYSLLGKLLIPWFCDWLGLVCAGPHSYSKCWVGRGGFDMRRLKPETNVISFYLKCTQNTFVWYLMLLFVFWIEFVAKIDILLSEVEAGSPVN